MCEVSRPKSVLNIILNRTHTRDAMVTYSHIVHNLDSCVYRGIV